MRFSRVLVSFAWLLLSVAVPAFSQHDTDASFRASLSVVVSDPSGARIPDADVLFDGPRKLVGKTLNDGSIHVSLPYGEYLITVAKAGFETAKISHVLTDSSARPILTIVLQVGHYCEDCCDECGPTIQPTTSDLPVTLEDKQHENIELGGGLMVLSPLSAHAQFLSPCADDKPCVRVYKFDVDPKRENCCKLTVRNGDGQGNNQVKDYKIFLNGKLLPSTLGGAQVDIHLRRHNTVKAILVGQPSSKLLVFFAYTQRTPM